MENETPKDVPTKIYAAVKDNMPNWLSNLIRNFFFSISPDVPYNLSKRIREISYINPIKYGFLIGWVLCVLLPVIFCFYDNTLYPEQCTLSEAECNEVVFLSRDIVNIIMYTLITPISFSIGMAMLLATFRTWNQFESIISDKRSSLLDWKGFIVMTLILVVSSFAISNYINEIVNTTSAIGIKANELHFWFLGDPNEDNSVRPITIYYTILNFLILVFYLSSLAVFVTAIRPIIRLSESLKKMNLSSDDVRKNLIERLSSFADVYFFAKMLLAVAMIHSFVWSYSELSITSNFDIERGLIVVISIFFIAIPRLHFELEWYRSAKILKKEGIDLELKPDYIRGFNYYAIWIADYLVIGGYFLSILGFPNWGNI